MFMMTAMVPVPLFMAQYFFIVAYLVLLVSSDGFVAVRAVPVADGLIFFQFGAVLADGAVLMMS